MAGELATLPLTRETQMEGQGPLQPGRDSTIVAIWKVEQLLKDQSVSLSLSTPPITLPVK